MKPTLPNRQQIIDAIRARDGQMPQRRDGGPEAQFLEALRKLSPPEVLADQILAFPPSMQHQLLRRCLPELLPKAIRP